ARKRIMIMTPSPSPHVKVTTEQGVLILTLLDKELRTETQCAAVREVFLDAVKQAGAKKVVVDFRFVHFLSSVAFRPLLSLRRLVHETAARLVLCGLSEMVAEVFHATRLLISTHATAAPFEEKPDVAAAIAYLNQAGQA